MRFLFRILESSSFSFIKVAKIIAALNFYFIQIYNWMENYLSIHPSSRRIDVQRLTTNETKKPSIKVKGIVEFRPLSR